MIITGKAIAFSSASANVANLFYPAKAGKCGHHFRFDTLLFMHDENAIFRPDVRKNGKKRMKINILLIDSMIHKYVQL